MEPITTLTGYILSRFLHGIRILLITATTSLFISHTAIAQNIKNKAPAPEDSSAGARSILNLKVENQSMIPEKAIPGIVIESGIKGSETQNYNTQQNNYDQTKASTTINEIAANYTTTPGKPHKGDEIEIASAKLQSRHILFTVQQKTGASDSEMTLFTNYYYDKLFGTDVSTFWNKVKNEEIITGIDIQKYANQRIDEYVQLFNTFRKIEQDYPSSIAEYTQHRTHAATAVCNPACDNIGFENGNLSAWSAYYAQNTSSTTKFSETTPTGGTCGAVQRAALDPNTNTYQVAMTSGTGTDPVAGSLIPIVCPTGGSYSCRIGDSTRNGAQIGILQQTFNVTSANANFTYMYAVVLENPGHGYYQQPYFNVQMLDQNGNAIPNCGNYSVVSGPGLPGYKGIYYAPDADTVYCKPWTTVFVPLQAYIGQCVTIIVTVSDCSLGGHFGYAYFDATCLAGIITSLPVLCGNVATLTATAPSGASTYKWMGPCIVGPTNNQSITVSCPGVYKVAITSIIGSACADTIIDTVLGSVPPTVSVTQPSTNISCYGGSNGTATATASGGAGSFTYLWSPGGQTNSIATNLSAGTYSVNVTDANGCITSATATIIQPTALTLSTANTPAKCDGDKTGSASVIANGGTPPYTYSWAPTGGTNSSASNLGAGTYTVTVTDANNCTTTATASVSQPSVLASTISSVAVSCNGGNNGSATVSISGGTSPYTYAWAPKGGYSTSASNLNSGSYSVTSTDANGCVITSTINVTEPTPITTSGSSSGTSCYGGINGSATIVANGGTPPYSYFWAPYGGSNPVANGLSAGTYTVTITDAHNCKNTATIPVTQPTLVIASTISSNVGCYGGNNGTAMASAIGGAGSFTYLWLPGGQTNSVATNLSAGTYSANVTDANGCTTSATATITQPTPLTLSTANTPVKCNGDKTGSASVNANGGTPPYTYSWAPTGGTNSSASNLGAGTYTVTVTDANSCTTTAKVSVSQPAALASTISSVAVSCNGGNNGSAIVSISGGTSPYNYTWAPKGGYSTSASNLNSGSYSVTSTDANGCVITSTINVTEPTPIATSGSSSGTSCYGGINGSATIVANGGTPPYSYFWAPYGGSNPVANGLSAGTYTVTITDAHNCKNTATIPVTQPALLAALNISSNVSCNGGNNGTAKVTATGGITPYSYAWLPNVSTADSATNLPVGIYAVIVTDAHNCSATATINIVQPSLLTAIQGPGNNVSCNGGNNGSTSVIAVGGTLPYTYSWSPKGGTSYAASNLPAGTYTVTVTDAHNCPVTSVSTISQPQVLTASVTTFNNVSCNGGSNGSAYINAIGGTGSYTYSWSPKVSTASSAGNLKAGTYTVTVTDANGCIANTTVIISQPATLKTTATTSSISCYGGKNGSINISTSGGTPSYTYSWNPAISSNASAGSLSAGNYTVTITDANGCNNIINTALSQPKPIIATPTMQPPTCNGLQNGSASVSVSGGVPPYKYVWGTSNPQYTSAINNIGAGTYTIMVSDANGCTKTDTVKVTQPFALISTIVNTANPICFGDSNGSTSVYVSGGTVPYKYSWNTTPVQTGYIASKLGAGNYTVTVVDANNCPTSATISLTQPTQVITTATAPDSICSGTTVTIMASGNGGDGTYTYQWSNGGGSIATQNVTPINSTTYTVTAIDGNGCVGTPATVTINTWNLGPANVTVSPLQTVCHGDTVTLFANVTNANSGQVNIQWSNGYNGSGPFKMVLPTDTSFTITVTNQCGSTVTKSIPVKINPLPVIKIPVQSSASCRGVTFTYHDSSSEDEYDSYLWNFGDSTTGNTNPISHSYNQTGTYTVTVIVTSPEGCRSTVSAPADVMIYPTAKAIFTADPTEAPISEPTISFKDASLNTTTWMYDLGDKTTSYEQNPVHTYADTGNYLVHLYTNNKYGCADTAQAEVRIDPEFTFYVPDAFTPNGDGLNDFFTGKGIGIIGFDMVIYDRWGQYIFETQDINTGWNGTVNGGTAIAQEDTYVYVIKVVDYLHKVHSYLGSVTIIK